MQTDGHDLTLYPRLLGDVGGTNARWAMQAQPGATPSRVMTMPCADFDGPQASVLHYLQAVGAPAPQSASIGIACPILGDEIRMINAPWVFSARQLQADLGLKALKLLNDFTALALCLPVLQDVDVRAVGGGQRRAGMAMGLIGAGTGLGVSGLLPAPGGRWIPIAGEGGHVTLAAANDDEAALLTLLRRQFPHVSAERVLSGPGLVVLYRVHSQLMGLAQLDLTPSQVAEQGVSGQCPACRAAIDSFCCFMGTVAADLAVTLGTQGGMFIGGGIVPKLGDYFVQSGFRARFEQKGRYSAYVAAIPTCVIVHAYPGLLGAGQG